MFSKTSLRKNIDKGSRLKQYFLRGHNAWFALVFSIMNFTLIFYDLLFIDLYFVPSWLKNYSTFLFVFGIIYFPLSSILGYLDFKKGTYAAEASMQKELNPVTKEMFQKLDKIESDNQKILELLDNIGKNSK